MKPDIRTDVLRANFPRDITHLTWNHALDVEVCDADLLANTHRVIHRLCAEIDELRSVVAHLRGNSEWLKRELRIAEGKEADGGR